MWFVHRDLLLRLPWRTWGCPWEGQVWRWCSCLGRRVCGSTRYSEESATRAAGNIVLLKKGMETSNGQYTLVFLPGECPPTEAWQAIVHKVTTSWTRWKRPHMHRWEDFFCLWQVSLCEGWAWRWHSCLGLWDPGGAKSAGTQTTSATGVMALSESFFELLVVGDQKPFWLVFLHSSTCSGP